MDPSHRNEDELIDRLTEALTAKDDAVPEPSADFERAIWARVRPQTTGRPRWTVRVLVPAAALAASVVFAIVIGQQLTSTPAPVTETATVEAPAASQQTLSTGDRVLLTALDVHLAQTEALLVEVRNAPDRGDFSWEQTMADDLVSAGRLYRQSAEFSGRPGVVRVLDDLEPVLVELARSGKIAEQERDWLRTRINDDNLLFKVRAMSSDLKDLAARGLQ